MDLNALIYLEFNNIDYCIAWFDLLGIFNLIKSRSYRSEIKNKKKKLQFNVILDFINNCDSVWDDIFLKNILKMYSNYLFLYEFLKKGD